MSWRRWLGRSPDPTPDPDPSATAVGEGAVAEARRLADQGDVLEAWAALAGSTAQLGAPVNLLAGLARELYARGYLRSALAAFAAAAEAAAAPERRERLGQRRDRLASAIALLEGDDDPQPEPAAPRSAAATGRVLHVVKQTVADAQSGYTIRTHRTAAAQARAGWEVHVVGQLGFGSPEERTTWTRDGVTYHRLLGPPMSGHNHQAWFAQQVAQLTELVRELGPDVLHAASNHLNGRAARLVGAATGTPVVYEVRGFWEETVVSRYSRTYGWDDLEALEARFGLPDYYLLHREAETREWRRADALVTLAPVMRDRIVASGVDPDRVHLVPNAVDPDEFEVAARDTALLQSLGFHADTQVIGYVSSLVEYEGIDDLIRAFALLRERRTATGPPLGLLLVGDGADRERLEAVADEVGRDGIVFTGSVPHDAVVAHYGLIDVFVVPRRPVPVCHLVTPLKPYEAMALGRAVVMSDVAALAGIAEESGGAVLARAGVPESFAEQVERLLDDPGARADLAATGRSWVVRERTWDVNAELYAAAYASLGVRRPALGSGPPADGP